MNQPRFEFFTAPARGIAAFLGGFTLLNLLGELLTPNFNANDWWIDARFLPSPVASAFLTVSALLLIAFAMGLGRFRAIRIAVQSVIALLILVTSVNALQFWIVTARGIIHPGTLLPLSAILAAALIFILLTTFTPPPKPRGLRTWLILTAALLASAILFPLAQMYCFGKTDYRRTADAIVVLGARTYADGKPSQALADRVRTACKLYQQGLAPHLIFSGGPGDGPIDEPHAMRTMALDLGVPDAAITLDPAGLNTEATVQNTLPLLHALNAKRILVVSHFYHLPRCKMTFERRAGSEFTVFTVPAEETYPLVMLPRYMAREVIALWGYYLRPLAK